MSGETERRRHLPPLDRQRTSLVVVDSPDSSVLGRRFDLTRDTVILGREVDGLGRIDDRRMSRQHAEIGRGAEGAFVADRGGANGTFVDGAEVTRADLVAGSVVSMGDTLLVVDADPDPDDLPASEDADADEVSQIVGASYATERLRRSIATVARSRGTVLLLGPSGAGKEVAARAIHGLSGRPGPFVPVNCAAIPADLAEAELFGHKKGSFTGADRDKDGFFVLASSGTLFLDEVGDLPLPLQAKLLRVLEDQTIQVVGDPKGMSVDVRIVAATNVDLSAGGFRADLLARLEDWTLRLPRLADRKADVIPMWRHFLAESSSAGVEWTAELAEALLLHDWPMNVRELRKLAQRTASLARADEPLDLHLLPLPMQAPLRARSVGEIDGAPSRDQLDQAMRLAGGNVKLAAERNGWHRTQLYRWLRREGIDPGTYRE